ncbi:protein bride of sevenless [Aedes aegypti]|uniref:G-protein coupled receptors family 3 profile domain-containing protein n=1 Tax=Aedes aegypti TaxID=7159 RepID=A0A6I8TE00_AEDAE|nr:protein bride of sevenless [Aedes aegypti]XP_021710278.1 protein bride of sevenless [Aedes aegypti]XP_021710279.1 protein bride of sevenless [Aedes aegypti]XP_021710280.1 protein bride of sevenless [Aedes aegypti]XP_021710281.1 protein bride of sevenless [Aedes aegypti]XP_021710282.1 protein bride of sevenless [Aedes aegypti]XP_021710283.1 protein bride of sevenless [Aedes aegypti]XP_021710284.1 protein bride of sevenless [Aedes aegypti]
MRRENGWRKRFYICGLILLLFPDLIRSNDVSEILESRILNETRNSDQATTVESIHTTKTIEEITDNSILISATSSSSLPEIVSPEENSSVSSIEDEEGLTNETIELTSASSENEIGIFIQYNQTEPAIPDADTTSWTSLSNCSNYTVHKNVVDLSIDGGYSYVRHRERSNWRRGNQRLDSSGDHDTAEPESHNRTLMDTAAVSQVVYSLDGDFSVSLITDRDDFGASLFTVDRINKLQLINDNGTLGLRVVVVQNVTHAPQILRDEVSYLKECLANSVGIFIDPSIWPAVQSIVDSLDYNIYPFPSSNDLLYSKAAHLLYELPWSNPNSSIAVRSESAETSNKFTAICRHEHLCLENFPSDHTIFIILGLTRSVSFATNGTLIVVLSGRDMLFVSDLPNESYIITENEINLPWTEDSDRYGSNILASDVLSSGSVFLELVELLNLHTKEFCSEIDQSLCSHLNATLDNWQYYAKLPSQKIISMLKLQNFTQSMTFEMRQKFSSKANSSEEILDLKPIASSNMVTNVTTLYHLNEYKHQSAESLKLGNIFFCSKEFEIRHPDYIEHRRPIYHGNDYYEMYWQVKQEAWVAAGLTIASLGILFCLAILIFLIVRVCMDDVLEGNPLSSILLLISLIFQFASFLPFSLEYTGYMPDLLHKADTIYTWNTLCTVKIFLLSVCYCTTFSLLLCRAIMLASIGSEGGFLSHVNGYLQSVICIFSTLVQLGLSTQLVIVLHASSHNISCNEIYYGNWFWATIAYDGILLAALIVLSPYIFRSQRNYREGMLLVTGSILCLVIWTTWIPLCVFGYEWREAAVSLGLVATALAVLVGVMIPRCFLMVRSIARSDLVQALPSLTSLAFAQANQYISEQSVYECVNPAMRQQRSATAETFMEHEIDEPYLATSEIPTLPLRGNRRNNYLQPDSNGNGINVDFYGISNPYSCSDSIASEHSPNKNTRF